MAVSNVIRIGDKVDIRLVQQIENSKKTGGTPDLFRSQVLGAKENGNFEIAMPSEKGKLILLPLGVQFEFVFYSYSGALYTGVGQIIERYKKDGFYMLEIELKTPLKKLQRREFYRYNCAMDFSFFTLNQGQMKIKPADDIYRDIRNGEIDASLCDGLMVDLSGGGMKFRSPFELKQGENILIMLHLKNDRMDRKFNVLAQLIACRDVHTSRRVMYESRVRFIIEDNEIREEIIRYIFEEERRIRRKVSG